MPKKKRPTVITLIAGWLILCSVVGVIVFSATIPRVETIQTNGEGARWIVEHLGRGGLLVLIWIVYLSAGSMGIGLWKLRWWGRAAMLTASAALVATSLVVGSITAVWEHAFDMNALFLLMVFGWPLYYFNRPKIKRLFA